MEAMFSNSNIAHETIGNIQFSVLSPEEILKQSVTTPDGISYPEVSEGGKPKIGGVMDPRQGVVDKSSRCLTCNGKMNECPGHFGHINLAKPVFYGHYLPHVRSILRCICLSCSKPYINPNSKHLKDIMNKTRNNLKNRRTLILEAIKKVRFCGGEIVGEEDLDRPWSGCKQNRPKVIKRKGLELTAQWKKSIELDEPEDRSLKLSAEKVLEIFKAIDNESVEILGLHCKYARPEWMVATVLPVLPLCVRPSVLSFGTTRCQDDLTHKLADIVKANNQLKESEKTGMATHILEDHLKLLEYHINTMFDNSMPGVPKATQKSGRPLKAIKERLSSKEGRVRGNLMGKRVDFCARTVITPDPILRIDEVGVPRDIAQILTYPEIVTPFNIEKMSTLVTNGPDHYPGAAYVINNNGDRINLRLHSDPSKLHLETGYKVERHLQDGDPVIFNRQPSLHKMSMMCHRAKVMPGSTFRLNLSVTKPYNADFDGDEMNLHLPQSLEARAEVMQLSSVSKMIITPQSNKPVMGIVQDTLTGVYKMTSRNEFITKHDLMNLLIHFPMWNGKIPQPAILRPVPLWTGKQLFSILIPGKVNCLKNIDGNDKWMTPSDTTVLVENGELLMGILCKKTLGSSEGSLLHVVYLEEGSEKTAEFYSNIQLVVNQWLLIEGHSVGVSDMIADTQTYNDIRDLITNAKTEIAVITEDLYAGRLSKLPGCDMRQTYENKVNVKLNEARDKAGRQVQKSLSRFNNLNNMVAAGSKGDSNNISQIIACVGQQNVEGKRISFGFSSRTASHFVTYDHGPEARGFVENSYISGLNFSEFFFHAMAGREGIIDTAIKTSETGYIQRRLIKAMESIKVNYDGTVRNQTDQLIELCYGGDGLSGEWVESQNLVSLKLNNREFAAKYKFDVSNEKKLKRILDGNVLTDINKDCQALNKFDSEYERLLSDRVELRKIFPNGHDGIVLPCNLKRLIWNAQKKFKINQRTSSKLNPLRVIDDVRELCEKLKVIRGSDSHSVYANNSATLLMNMMLRSTFSSKRVAEEFHLSSEAFEWLLGEVETRFTQAHVHPGEMVGVLAAQSLGEPATQMTLNTFHHAGISSKNITLGVPRLKEIINVSKKPKCPTLTIFLDSETSTDVEKAHDVMNTLSYTVLKDVIESSEILYEPDTSTTSIKEDLDLVTTCHEISLVDPSKLSPFVLRMKLNPEKLYGQGKSMKASLVEERIREAYRSDLDVASFDEKNLVRLRLIQAKNEEVDEEVNKMEDVTFLTHLDNQMQNELVLKGIPAIKGIHLCQSSAKTKQIRVLNADGDLEITDNWYLESEGTSMREVLGREHVDYTSSVSNDIVETFEVLGIEAAKRTIERELHTVLSFDGSYVNHRHLTLLCEIMTNKGHLMAITRHGINKQETGPISRATFEETLDIFVEAATHAELDPLKGVSESVMLGKLAKIGTGSFDVFIDPKMYEQYSANDFTDLCTTDMTSKSLESTGTLLSDILNTPAYNSATPAWDGNMSPITGDFSPAHSNHSPVYSPYWGPGNNSPSYPASPSSPVSPRYSPASPVGRSSMTPAYTPLSTGCSYKSPAHTPMSPTYSNTSPTCQYSPAYSSDAGNLLYSPSSSVYSPYESSYSPSALSPSGMTPSYSPSSYSLTSPDYAPYSPKYSPSYKP